jgi:hypothetical protein
MKKIKSGLIAVVSVLLMSNVLPSFSITPDDITSYKYLYHHGHSPELICFVYLQKTRLESETAGLPDCYQKSKFRIFLENMFIRTDATLPMGRFGNRTTKE